MTAQEHLDEMLAWAEGRKSTTNQRLHLSEDRAVAVAMIDVADTAMVVKHGVAALVLMATERQSDHLDH